ncbi:MAG: inositol monophosphatase family protein [Henriciella sp.]
MSHPLASDLELASTIAKQAGNALAARGARFEGVDKEEGRDIKLAADKAAERLILDYLAEHSPYPVLSEEEGWVEGRGERLWVVDPLDGSSNYVRDFPLCAVSIALIENERPVLGVVYDFFRDEMFAGLVGHGATLNGAPMSVSDVSDRGRATLMTGFPVRADFSDAALTAMARDFASWKKIRMIGTAALAAAYVAAGRADCYREQGSMLWDIAAGCALIEAAGGKVQLDMTALDAPMNVTAWNGRLDI